MEKDALAALLRQAVAEGGSRRVKITFARKPLPKLISYFGHMIRTGTVSVTGQDNATVVRFASEGWGANHGRTMLVTLEESFNTRIFCNRLSKAVDEVIVLEVRAQAGPTQASTAT